MSPEAQNVAIAEAVGWIKFWYQTGEDEGVGRWEWHRGNLNQRQPPDYLNSLDAMHSAEKTLNPQRVKKGGTYDLQSEPWELYFKRLLWISERDDTSSGHATAAQRAEAFLRCKGLWKEAGVQHG